MFDNRFPYTDITKINLDWILRTLKNRIESAGVSSVNGLTGDVTLGADDVGAFPTVIEVNTAGEDIDTYTENGIWYFPAAYRPVNQPEYGTSGFLIVLRGSTTARMVQVWMNNAATDKRIYSRNNATAIVNWTDWADYATDNTTVVRGNVRKNNSYMVKQFLDIAKTYYDNRQYITYGNTTFLDEEVVNGKLDCSSFVSICMRGIPFEDTPLNPAWTLGPVPVSYWVPDTAKYAWAWNPSNYTVSTKGTGPCRRASQFGKLMTEWGMRVVMDEEWCNLEPGDLVFYSSKDGNGDWVEPNTWLHISHVGICYSKTDTPINGYPYTHRIMDVSGLNADDVGLNTLETNARTQYISLVIRPDFGSLIPKIEEMPVTVPTPADYFEDSMRVSVYKMGTLTMVRIIVVRDATARRDTYATYATGLPRPVAPSVDDLNRVISLGALQSIDDDTSILVNVNAGGNLRLACGTPGHRYSGTIFYFSE